MVEFHIPKPLIDKLLFKIKKKNLFEIECLNKEHIIYSFEFCNIHLNDGLIALLPPQADFLSIVLKRSSTYVSFLALIKF